MRYLLILFILLPSLCSASGVLNPYSVTAAASSTCSSTPTITQTGGTKNERVIGAYSSIYFAGNLNTGTTSYNVCRVEFGVNETGDVSSKYYHAKIYSTVSGSTSDLSTLKGTSNVVAGTALNGSTEVYLDFTFDTAVTYTTNDVIVMSPCDASGTDLAADSTNYISSFTKYVADDFHQEIYGNTGTYYDNAGVYENNWRLYESN